MFRSSLGRAVLGKVYHLPNKYNCISACRRWVWYDGSKVNCTSGTSSFSACDEAASVVTARFDRGTNARCVSGAARLVLKALLNMIDGVALEGSYQFQVEFRSQVGKLGILNVGRLALKCLVDFDAALHFFRKPKGRLRLTRRLRLLPHTTTR